MSNTNVTRRDFVADSAKITLGAVLAAPGFPMIVKRHVLGGPGFQAPSDTLNFAVVGFGGMGSGNAQELAKTERLVAVCDVDLAFAERNVSNKLKGQRGEDRPEGLKLQEQFSQAKKYNDWREMLDAVHQGQVTDTRHDAALPPERRPGRRRG